MLRIQQSPSIPNKDSVCGFAYEAETGRLREVAKSPSLTGYYYGSALEPALA